MKVYTTKLKYLIKREKYIQIAYLEYRDIQNMYFHIQFVSTNIEEGIRESIHSYYRKSYVNICKKRKQNYSQVIGTSIHDELKSKKRLREIQICSKIKSTDKHQCIKQKRRKQSNRK